MYFSKIPSYYFWLAGMIMVSIFIILGDRFLVADSFIRQESIEWKKKLEQRDIAFFSATIADGEEKDKFLSVLSGFDKILDVKVVQEKDIVFFSFLALKKDSSVLLNGYGNISFSIAQKFSYTPNFTATVLQKTPTSMTIKNTSGYYYPMDTTLLALPSDAKGTPLLSGELLYPDEVATIRFTDKLPKDVVFLESIPYGFKIKLLP